MNSKLFFSILLILGGAVVFGLIVRPKRELSRAASLLPTQSKTIGVVEIEVTPISISPGKELVFELAMNNHTVDLSYDYTKLATLTDDQGYTYQPSRWIGNTSGHHIKGQLIFPSLSNKPKKLTLRLDGIDNKSENFIWQL